MSYPNDPPWKCYHCGFVAQDDVTAVEHFGQIHDKAPECITGDRFLWASAFEQEAQLRREFHSENKDLRSQLLAAQERAEKAEAAIKAFRHVDELDWNYLDTLIGHGGRDKFWRAVFAEFRAALKPKGGSIDGV